MLRLPGMVTLQCHNTFAASLQVLPLQCYRMDCQELLGNLLILPAHAQPILVLMRPDYDTNFAFAFLAFAQHASTAVLSPEEYNKI